MYSFISICICFSAKYNLPVLQHGSATQSQLSNILSYLKNQVKENLIIYAIYKKGTPKAPNWQVFSYL